MNTELWREWSSTRRFEQITLFKKEHPHLDFTPKHKDYPHGDYKDQSVYPIEHKWCEEQDALLIAERLKLHLVIGDIVKFRSMWSHPDCNDIHPNQLAIVHNDHSVCGYHNQNACGLEFLGEHMYYRTCRTEYLDKVEFLASEPEHVELRALLKAKQAKDAKDKEKQYQDWLTYEAKLAQIRKNSEEALTHISC